MKVFLGTAAVTTQKVKEWSEILLHILKGYPQVPDRQTSEISDNEWTIEVSTAQRQRLISQSYEEQDDFITEE